MALPRILVLVLAGGAGGRLELLTDRRAKPAVPELVVDWIAGGAIP